MLLAITHDIGHKGYINIGLAVGGWMGARKCQRVRGACGASDTGWCMDDVSVLVGRRSGDEVSER